MKYKTPLKMQNTYKLLSFFILISVNSLYAQTATSVIIDQENKEPIPYATIKYAEFKGVITNEEGNFTINDNLKNIDSITVSSIGYATQKFAITKLADTLQLKPEDIKLSSVFLSTKNYTIDEIIENVADNLEKNHHSNYTKHRFFMRESNHQTMKQFKFDFLKSSIEEISEKLIDSMVRLVPKHSSFYSESLGDFYSKTNTDETKLTLIKASKLYDKNSDATSEALQEKFTNILKKNIKQDSYLKIKSGWFGTKMQVDSILPKEKSIEDSLKNKLKQKRNEQKYYFAARKNTLSRMMKKLFFDEDSKINVIDKSNRYEFTLKGVIDFQDELAYVINYKPKRSEDFKGTLYINTIDFAVLRIDYESVAAVYDRLFNMLGVNINHLKYKGTAVFSKDTTQQYSLKYASHTNISSAKINRPLTIIEKNKHVKGRRKQNELKLDMHIHSITVDKREIVVFDATNVNNFDTVKENKDIKIQYFSKYNAAYWKGYNIIEPNQAIKEFQAVE